MSPSTALRLLLVCTTFLVAGETLGATPPPLSNPNVSPEPAEGDPYYGAVAGQAVVSAGGNAAYSIPIQLPPGRGGLSPQLSLNYNSNMQNGMLGLGWFLTGTSKINRCPKTLAQEGESRPVRYDIDDVYCLDGNKLIAVSGTYGADGTLYRTEIDQFSSIKSIGASGEGPAYFEVKTKGGLINRYGYTDSARVEGKNTSTVREWALDQVTDRSGNYYTLDYYTDTSEGIHYITSIEYNRHDALNGGAADTAVDFGYESRPDSVVRYEAGTKVQRTPKRLNDISIYQDGQLAYYYSLSYEKVGIDNRSRLIQVDRCDAASTCQEPIVLTWETDSTDVYTESSLTVPYFAATGSTYNYSAARLGFDKNTPRWHDMNGDGRPDYVYAKPNGDGSYPSQDMQFKIKLSTPTGYTTEQWQASLGGDPADFYWVDINGDGKTDIVKLDVSAGTMRAALAGDGDFVNGSAYDTYSFWMPSTHIGGNKLYLSDVNGDGLIDIVKEHVKDVSSSCWNEFFGQYVQCYVPDGFEVYVHLNKGHGWGFEGQSLWLSDSVGEPGDFRLMDLTGDGLADFVYQDRHVYPNTGSEFDPQSIHFGAVPYGSQAVYYADVNGDGLPDRYVLKADYSCCDVQINNGTKFKNGSATDKLPSIYLDDNDLPDAYLRNDPGRYVDSPWYPYNYNDPEFPPNPTYTNTVVEQYLARNGAGTSYTTYPNTTRHDFLGEVLSGFMQWTDINGDGLLDLTLAETDTCYHHELQGYVNGVYSHAWRWYYCETDTLKVFTADGAPLNLLKSVTQGRDVVTEFTYKPLTDSSVYTKGTSAVFPDFDIQDSTQVVSQIKGSDGIGGFSAVDYTYEGLVRNVQGLGSLGFAKIIATNVDRDSVTINEYAQQFPYSSHPVRTEVRRLSDNRLLASTDTVYDEVSTFPGVVFPYVASKVENNYALEDGRLLSTQTTTTDSIDDYGNILQSTVTLIDHENGDGEYARETDKQFDITPDHSTWRVADLTSYQEKAWLNGINDPGKDRRTDYTYYATTGLLATETTEPGRGAGIERVRSLTYDVYGNLKSETISGPGLATRASTIDYDSSFKFAETLTNALGHTIQQTWDPVYGNKLTQTDANGQITTWTYGAFGVPERETRPDGTYSETKSYTYDVAQGHPFAAFYTETLSPGQAPARIYFDKLGRKVRARTQAFDGQYVNVDIDYDSKGRDYRTSEPYFDGAVVIWNTKTYDHLGRVTALAAADPVGSLTMSYNGYQVVTTDAVNRSEVHTTDARGSTIEVVDKAGTKMNFEYDAVGNRVAVYNAVGLPLANSVTYTYDRLGRMISQDDPDHGLYTYTYDALGNKLTEVSPKLAAAGQSISYTYDLLGRMASRTEPEGTTTWTFDDTTGGNLGIGQVHSESQNGFTRTYQYANGDYGRLTGTTTSIDGNNYSTALTYDAVGRVSRETYPASTAEPNGFMVEYVYSPVGPLEAVQSLGGGTVFYQLMDTDAAGRITEEWLGDGSTVTQAYDGHSGRITDQESDQGGTAFQHFAYTYDDAGNMLSRSDLVQNLSEAFTYDDLDRLRTAQVGNNPVANYGFDEIGNITQNTDSYSYDYNSSAVHAVTNITGAGALPDYSYGYDANGNMNTVDGMPTITWSSYNKPTVISSGGVTYAFSYGPDRKRYKKIRNGLTTHYVGGGFEAIGNPALGMDTFRHYIRANGRVVMIREDNQGTVTDRYLHRDHLGSITAITDEVTGNVVDRFSYDAWGKRRSATDWVTAVTSASEVRGYTGHEHLDDVGLIHMNGRVYSPALGRMLSPDPATQAPEDGQNYNRYSYANNNPLMYADPSGYEFTATYPGAGCVNAAEFGGTNVLADIHCGFDVVVAIKTLGGLLGGNGCDETCQIRFDALYWCKAQGWCSDALGNTREKFRRRSALAIQQAVADGDYWFISRGRAVVVEIVGSELEHHYHYETEICPVSWGECTVANVWKLLLENSVPGQDGILYDQASNELPGGFGTVTTSVDNENHILVNSTEDDHIFKYGTVTREIIVKNGHIYVATTGEGINQSVMKRVLNELASYYFPNFADQLIRVGIYDLQAERLIRDAQNYMHGNDRTVLQ